MLYIDAHTHLAKYDENMFEVISEIEKHEILTVSVSMDSFLYEKNLEIAKTCSLVIPTFGIHPWSATRFSYKLGELVENINRSAMIGEIGLDFYFVEETENYEHQIKVFDFFLEAAREQNKIVNLHTKGAEKEVLTELQKHSIHKAIVHWYSGPTKLISDYLELGCYFTVGVEALSNKKIQNIIKLIPDERLLTETDNPGGYEWLNQKPGMPSLIIEVVDKLAEIKNVTPDEIKLLIMKNFNKLIENDKHIGKNIKSKLSGLLY